MESYEERIERFGLKNVEDLVSDLIVVGKIKTVTDRKILVEPTIEHVMKADNKLLAVIGS